MSRIVYKCSKQRYNVCQCMKLCRDFHGCGALVQLLLSSSAQVTIVQLQTLERQIWICNASTSRNVHPCDSLCQHYLCCCCKSNIQRTFSDLTCPLLPLSIHRNVHTKIKGYLFLLFMIIMKCHKSCIVEDVWIPQSESDSGDSFGQHTIVEVALCTTQKAQH